MADNLGDYGNFFSGDYWNSKAKAQRDADRKKSSTELAQKQNKSNVDTWNAIGTGLGIAGPITNLINGINAKKSPAPKQSAATNKSGVFSWKAGDLALRPNAAVPVTQHPFSPNGTRQGADDIPESTYRDGTPQSPLDILMERLNQQYQGPDPSKMDFSALDKALSTRLGQIGDTRNQVQGNFDKSDKNVAAMHQQFENQIRTEDAASYNKIADQNKGNLTANMNNTVGAMEASRAKAVAERQAMMQNLGQQASAGAPDPNADVFNRGIATAQERNNTDQVMADGKRANNLAYNNTVASSVGQAGIQRRSALQGQLQGILGKLSQAEAEAKATDQTERQRAISSANDSGYKQWSDGQDRTLDIWKTLSGEGLAREKMGMDTSTPKLTGVSAIADSVSQSGLSPDEASQGMAALQSVLSEGNYLQGANGGDGTVPYDRTNVIIQKLKAKGLDPSIATAVGIAYSKS